MKYWMVFLTLSPVFAQGPQVVGATTWKLLNGAPLASKQQIVPTNATIVGSRASDLILNCGNDGWLAYSCRREQCSIQACQQKGDSQVEVRRVDPVGWASPKASFGDMALSFFSREPKAAQLLGVRGGGNISDAVLRQSQSKVVWGPALRRVLEGSYCFRAEALPAGSNKPFVFTMEWNQTGDGIADVPGLAAGLYTLERGTSNGKGGCEIEDPDAAKAWVLIVPDQDFARVHDLWESYSSGLSEIAENVSGDVSATVSHAILASLANTARQ